MLERRLFMLPGMEILLPMDEKSVEEQKQLRCTMVVEVARPSASEVVQDQESGEPPNDVVMERSIDVEQ